MSNLDEKIISNYKTVIRFMLDLGQLDGLETAIALEEIASEIRQKQVVK